ncbi:MAG: PQQ-binding-like beta-propeller repeat protein [Planctomycetota bacterium]
MRQLTMTPAPLAILVATFQPVSAGDTGTGVHWPSFRGPRASGVADGFPTPANWDLTARKNVRWTTPIDGLGHSSPAIWGDRVFVTTAVSGEKDPELKVGLYGNIDPVEDSSVHTWKLYAIDKRSGEILWERTVCRGVPKIKRHPKSTHANSTPATDGRHVVAFFGSEGLYCYDIEGELLWKRDLGVLDSAYFLVPKAQWGFGSSPVIHEGAVIVQCDVLKDSFLAAYDLENGEEIWRTPRSDVPTWGTPTICTLEDREQVIVNGFRHIGGYDLLTGEELWKLEGGGDIPAPTPVVAHGLVFITNSHGSMSPLYAIRLEAIGNITPPENVDKDEFVAWMERRGGAYMPTPIVYGDYLYNCRDNGALVCYEAKTGEVKYRERLGGEGGGFTASPVAADGKVYLTSEDGDVFVVKAGAEYELLAENSMGEVCMATPAISEGWLFFRTKSHLVAIASE